MQCALPSTAPHLFQGETKKVAPLLVDDLECPFGLSAGQQDGDGIDHQSKLLVRRLHLLERLTHPDDQAVDHHRGGQEGGQGDDIQRLTDRQAKKRGGEEVVQAGDGKHGDPYRCNQTAAEGDHDDDEEIEKGGRPGIRVAPIEDQGHQCRGYGAEQRLRGGLQKPMGLRLPHGGSIHTQDGVLGPFLRIAAAPGRVQSWLLISVTARWCKTAVAVDGGWG
jgi:hypothetical protein